MEACSVPCDSFSFSMLSLEGHLTESSKGHSTFQLGHLLPGDGVRGKASGFHGPKSIVALSP